MEEWHEIEIKCGNCGEVMTGKIARKLTNEELQSLQGRDCAKCYLKKKLENDLKILENSQSV